MEDKQKVHKKVKFVTEICDQLGVELDHEFLEDPLYHAIIVNARGDMASISADQNLFEAALYAPEWSDNLIKWAEAEGFSDSQIKTQNLMHTATIQQICKFFL